MTEYLLIGIACAFVGFAIGVTTYDMIRRRHDNKKDDETRAYPRCSCHDPAYCDIHCIGKENFYRHHP